MSIQEVALFAESISHSHPMRINTFFLLFLVILGCTATEPAQTKAPQDKNIVPIKKVVALGVKGDVALHVWGDGKVYQGKSKREILSLESPILQASFSKDGELVAGVLEDYLFVASLNGSFEKKFTAPKTRMSSVAFDSNQQAAFFAGVDGRIYRWKFLAENSLKKPSFERYTGHGSVVSSVKSDINSPVFFSSDWVGAFSAWLPYDADRFSGSFDKNIFGSTVFQSLDKLRVNANRLGDVTPIDFIAPSNGVVFVATQTGLIQQWQIRGFKQTGAIQAHTSSLVALDADNKGFIVSVGRDGIVKTWNGATIGQITLLSERTIQGAEHAVIGESKVFVSLKDGTIEEFDK